MKRGRKSSNTYFYNSNIYLDVEVKKTTTTTTTPHFGPLAFAGVALVQRKNGFKSSHQVKVWLNLSTVVSHE